MSEIARLRDLNEELLRRLAEAEDALRAIGCGQVDAIVVDGSEGAQVFSLTGAERVYRLLVETMREAALTVSPEGTILFCNEQFCQLMRVHTSQALGRPLSSFVSAPDADRAVQLLQEAGSHPLQRRLVLVNGEGMEVPVQVAANLLETDEMTSICLVAADLTELEASAASIDDLREHQLAMQQVEAELRASRLAALNLMEDAIEARRETERAAVEAVWRSRRDELLSQTAARLLESRDPQGSVEELCREIMEFLDCHVFFNYLATGDEESTLRLNAYAGIPRGEAEAISTLQRSVAVCGCVAGNGQKIVAEDIQNGIDARTLLVKSYGVQAYCCHPLVIQGRTLGTLSFGTRTRAHFRPEEVEVMSTVANLVAMAMNRLEMEKQLQDGEERYRALSEEYDHLYHEQLDIAQTLQSAFIHLPAEVGPVQVSHLYRSATETARVGGDFYDAFRVKNGKIVVLIGDVSGHGVEAARMANLTKDVIRAFTGVATRPNDVLVRTNRLLLEEDFEGFVTVFLGIIDLERSVLRYASAGHPDALLRRASGDLLLLRGHSVPLGIYTDATWASKLAQTRPGDLLFLYTDGVIEARHDGRMYGEERLRGLIAQQNVGIDQLPRTVLDSVLEFSGETLRDDVAMMAVSLTAGDMLAGR